MTNSTPMVSSLPPRCMPLAPRRRLGPMRPQAPAAVERERLGDLLGGTGDDDGVTGEDDEVRRRGRVGAVATDDGDDGQADEAESCRSPSGLPAIASS